MAAVNACRARSARQGTFKKTHKRDLHQDTAIWFAPRPPAGHEANWVQIMPGKGWNVDGPLEPWFDKSWKPGDFELVE